MVHGIGTHPPGWSTRLQRNLSAELGLTFVAEKSKQIDLRSAQFPGQPLGRLTVFRFFNEARTRELLTYELSWSEITTPRKQSIDYDTSGAQKFRRAATNHEIKVFLNDSLTDPIAYLGDAGDMILEAAGEATCWMAAGDWKDLPDTAARPCDLIADGNIERL